jgi:hypothetical protein
MVRASSVLILLSGFVLGNVGAHNQDDRMLLETNALGFIERGAAPVAYGASYDEFDSEIKDRCVNGPPPGGKDDAETAQNDTACTKLVSQESSMDPFRWAKVG